ncbi:urease accessory protein UreD [Bosea sp. SSUT16]|jgi:urease accessory protein|uniref:Urease accessory protein UreD n=1 Tax=Bosea spartocytisi TaxID=2773451 RepID=A0A927HWM4_9HYPH|nr:urease accessory protein UreD [Bosea spartocytisi]MBD3844510.1 urease accessory protein UreD [Bosea spartocytisi]MCT4470383.1 urease accessory protein UreD [Bosea spartocytisi]
MFAPSVPAAAELTLPAYVRADGGVRLRFGRTGTRTQRLALAESGGYRARFPDTFGDACEAVLINTGGGMAGGDRMRVEAVLEAGSDAVIATQAAEKIYRSQGAETRIETMLSVGEGASLAWIPQESILFSGARLSRSLSIELAADARLVACESVFFGRSAMGETVERGALRDRWRVRRGGRLVFAEDMRLEGPVAQLLARPAIGAGARAAATLLVAGSGLATLLEAARACLSEAADVEGGAGIVSELLVIRLVSPEAAPLRRVLVTLLGHLTGRALPRTWST